MTVFLLALGIVTVTSVMAALAGRNARTACAWGVGGALAGCLTGLVPAVHVLRGVPSLTFHHAWAVPYGEFALAIDPLSAFFLLPIFGLSALAAVYGSEYLHPFHRRKPLGPVYGWYNLLIASMALVVTARNAILFLVAWEAMSLSSFFLVTFEDERKDVRQAGWTYLIAAHLGTAVLLVLFALLGREASSMNFEQFQAQASLSPTLAGALFLLALIGFGTKAGFLPLHVWLPEAHPAAPSHVSALMSGVMIKIGIYGIVRVLTFLGPPPGWWGMTLVSIGLTSGVLGVLFALAQHDLKRLLAYHSVENIGIIALGLGVGVLGQSAGWPLVSVLGVSGALLHVLNHSLFKGLLFLGAGSVLHATGTRELDHLGGLLKRMPWTGVTFLIGAMAICGLPPLNGFVSEWLIFMGGFHGIMTFPAYSSLWLVLGIAGLALIGGLAAACFTKAFGVIFLGTPRHVQAHPLHEAGPAMRLPMALLAAGCVVIGVWPHLAVQLVLPAVGIVTGLPLRLGTEWLASTATGLRMISATAAIVLSVMLALAAVRRRLLRTRSVSQAVTWDCGYAVPTERMQYTSSSFAQPLIRLFRGVLRTRLHEASGVGYFPAAASLASHTPDAAQAVLFAPVFRGLRHGLERFRWLQQGRVQLYLLYMFLTLIVLLVWKLGT